MPLLGRESVPTPGHRAIECPTTDRVPALSLLVPLPSIALRFSGYQLDHGMAMAGLARIAFAVMEHLPILEERSHFSR